MYRDPIALVIIGHDLRLDTRGMLNIIFAYRAIKIEPYIQR